MTSQRRSTAAATSASGLAGSVIVGRARVAQRLRGEPVLAVGAVQVAAEHAERQGPRPREQVEERLLLDRVDRDPRGVPPRHQERVPGAAAHEADAAGAVGELAAVRARHAHEFARRVRQGKLAPGGGEGIQPRLHVTNVHRRLDGGKSRPENRVEPSKVAMSGNGEDVRAVPHAPRGVRGSVRVPPSKSMTQRALVAAALAGSGSAVRSPLDAEDPRLLFAALQRAGFRLDWEAGAIVARGRDRVEEGTFFLGNNGTGARFLLAQLAALPGPLGARRLRAPARAPAGAAGGGAGATRRPDRAGAGAGAGVAAAR